MMKLRIGALFSIALLAGCGGGGGDGSTPTPTPTPTPAPAPTPPPPSYENAFDFSRDRRFDAIGVELRRTSIVDATGNSRTEARASALESDNGSVTIVYAAGTRTLTATFKGDVSTFQPDGSTVNNAERLTYNVPETATRPSDGITIAPEDVLATRYVLFGRQVQGQTTTPGDGTRRTTTTGRGYVLGVPTVASDVPTTGTAGFRTRIVASAPDLNGAEFLSEGTLTIDSAARRLSGSVVTTQRDVPAGATPISLTLAFDGTIDASGRIAGTVGTADGRYRGNLVGRLYGPQGGEFGLAFDLLGSDATRIVGLTAGKRQ